MLGQTSRHATDFAKQSNKAVNASFNTMENLGMWTSGVCRTPVKCAVYQDEGLMRNPTETSLEHWMHHKPYNLRTQPLCYTTKPPISMYMTISRSISFNWPGDSRTVRITQKCRFIRHCTQHIHLSQILTSHFKWKVGPPCNSPDLWKQLIKSCNKHLLVGTVHDRKQTMCTWTASNQN